MCRMTSGGSVSILFTFAFASIGICNAECSCSELPMYTESHNQNFTHKRDRAYRQKRGVKFRSPEI